MLNLVLQWNLRVVRHSAAVVKWTRAKCTRAVLGRAWVVVNCDCFRSKQLECNSSARSVATKSSGPAQFVSRERSCSIGTYSCRFMVEIDQRLLPCPLDLVSVRMSNSRPIPFVNSSITDQVNSRCWTPYSLERIPINSITLNNGADSSK